MRRSAKLWWAAGIAGAALLIVPAVGKALLPTTSCFAFAGVAPTSPTKEMISMARQVRADFLAADGVSMPKPPYVIVSRHEGDVGPDLLIATRTVSGWQIEEAGRPLEGGDGYVSPRRGPRPMSATSSRTLDALIAKTCLFHEPEFVEIYPSVWLGAPKTPGYWDGEGRFVEITDGVRSHSSIQNSFCGVTGAVGQTVVEAARGSKAPPQRCGTRGE